ncbi:esterase [Serinicoccus sp. CUA-874]|uniref:esterase family protein n=1 Tax=Serinicoccus sp. CUA-874 TaxID=1517939 RepID=UPI000968239E|nr:alpha/beta hydrolase-fold protein [Serinicoccus sp. CUA-874]OLT16614.1 esterase [Serinicoccus sp. CUA-874]
MEREQIDLDTEGVGRGAIIRYGHWGRPVLVFPSEAGRAWDFENNGMLDAVAPLLADGRIKLYAVDSFDHLTWSDNSLPTEERARRHGAYERWILDTVVPLVDEDSPGHDRIVTVGASMGGFHAVNFALKRPDLFGVGISLSGNFDPSSWHGWGELGEATYFANPTAYVAGMEGDHLQWVREHANILLVAGQGAFEVHPTQSLPGAHRMAGILADKGIPHEFDLWGHDSAHDWPWWRKQLEHHLPRFC